MNVLRPEKQLQIASMLSESMSIRSIERLTKVHRDTILRFLVRFGAKCQRTMDQHVEGACFNSLEVDELWGFIYKKERSCMPDDPPAWGDQYCFVAVCPDTKVAAHFELGKRTEETTWNFMAELARRVSGNVQVNTDGFACYRQCVPECFGDRASFMQIIKTFKVDEDNERKYSPPAFVGVDRVWRAGSPRREYATTSRVESQNASLRTNVRRLGRLTRCFSRKWENLLAALQVHFATYNMVRRHRMIGTAPMVEAGLISKPWTVEQLLLAN